MSAPSLSTIFLVTLFVCFSCAYHRKGSISFDISNFDEHFTLTDFYFDKGGIAAINVSPIPRNKASYSLLLCEDKPGDYDSNGHFPDCDMQVDIWGNISEETAHGSMVIPERKHYFLYLYIFDTGNSGFNVEITFLNPGNEHLSLSSIPSKYTYIVITILWLILSALGIGNWFMYLFLSFVLFVFVCLFLMFVIHVHIIALLFILFYFSLIYLH